MSKLVVILALYATVVSTLLLVQGRDGRQAAVPDAASEGSPDLRHLMAEARALMRGEIKDTLKGIDWRLGRLDALHKSMQEGLQAAQQAAQDAATANYGKLEVLEETVAGFAAATKELESIRASFVELQARVQAVEERPPQVVREIVKVSGVPGKAPVDTGPKRPHLPATPKKDPAVVAKEIAKAKEGLQSKDPATLSAAIEKIREHRVLEAVPRLIEIMQTVKNDFGRASAATALGKMQVCDAVPALLEALVDRSDLVAYQANKAIEDITKFDTELKPQDGIRRRRAARNRAKEWWVKHEDEVRARLQQPK